MIEADDIRIGITARRRNEAHTRPWTPDGAQNGSLVAKLEWLQLTNRALNHAAAQNTGHPFRHAQ